MNSVVWPGAIAILGSLLFLGAAGIFLLALQYRRHGRLSWRRTITTVAAVIYGFGLFSYTMLPLPATRDAFCGPGVIGAQLHPGQFLDDFAAALQLGERSFLTGHTLWQVLLNVLLFMPLGILAVRWLRGNILTAMVLGLTASVAIELTQYTGVWGLYTCAYRVADVDDLIMNTLGALLGAIIAYLPMFAFLAGPREGEARLAQPRPVTRRRRALANIFDAAFASMLIFVIVATGELMERLGGPDLNLVERPALTAAVVIFFVFLLPVLAPGRATLGQRCAWIQISGIDQKFVSGWQALLRTVIGFGGILFGLRVIAGNQDTAENVWVIMLLWGYILICAICFLAIPAARGLAGVITATSFTDRRSV